MSPSQKASPSEDLLGQILVEVRKLVELNKQLLAELDELNNKIPTIPGPGGVKLRVPQSMFVRVH